MNNILINKVGNHKHLGLNLNTTGTWNKHIEEITCKAWNRINVLRKLKFVLDRSSLQKNYFSFIRPILEYVDVVWSNCTTTESDSLEKIQNEAARIVTGATKFVSINDLYRETGWDKLSTRREKHKLIKFFNMKNGNCPEYLNNMVPTVVSETTTYTLRNSNDIRNIPCRTTLYSNSFLPSVIRQWNELPIEIRTCTSVNILKSYLDRDRHTPPKYFGYGNRNSQIIHTRLRLNCSRLKHHLYNKNLIDDPLCECGEVESTSHFFLYCPNYSIIRQQMITDVSRVTSPTLKVLLFGNDNLTQKENEVIFDKVHNYIIHTRRFE